MIRRHDSKISAIFWGFVYMLPFIVFLCAFLAYFQPFLDNSSSVSLENFSSWFFTFANDISFQTIITAPLSNFLFLFFDSSSSLDILGSGFVIFLLVLFNYYIMIHIVRLAIDVILFIPHLFHSWISKFDRKVD